MPRTWHWRTVDLKCREAFARDREGFLSHGSDTAALAASRLLPLKKAQELQNDYDDDNDSDDVEDARIHGV